MTSIGTGYDLDNSVFSPDGRLFQVEYAYKAVDNAGTAIGLRVKDGVILAVEKLVTSKLLLPGANRRIQTVDRHMGVATAGLVPDGRQLVHISRQIASDFRKNYRKPIPTKTLSEQLGSYVAQHTLYAFYRPFGVTSIVGGVDEDGPQLYMIEPSGLYWGYFGAAAGKGKQVAKNELEKLNLKEMTCRQAVYEAARIIYLTHGESTKDKEFELEMSWISTSETNNLHQPVPKDLLEDAEAKAKAEDEDEEMGDAQ